MAETSPSFGKQVFLRAWFSSWRFFESVRHDIALAVVGVGLVALHQYVQKSLPDSWSEWGWALLIVFGPFFVVWVLLFLWHLWLAPAALTYQRLSEAGRSSGEAPPVAPARPAKPINWNIWRQMDSWTIDEFAGVLAKEEPTSNRSGDARKAYEKLIRDDVDAGKLSYVKRYGHSDWDGKRFEEEIKNYITRITKSDAVNWAKAHSGFDVSHVE